MVNECHTHMAAESGRGSRQRGSLCSSFSRNMNLHTRKKAGAVRWTQHCPVAGRLLGELDGWQKGAQRQQPVQAWEAVRKQVKTMRGGQQEEQSQAAQAGLRVGWLPGTLCGRFETGRPMAQSHPPSTCSFPGCASPAAPSGPELLSPCDCM